LKPFEFLLEIALSPIFFSISVLAVLATLLPLLATFLFAGKPYGLCFLDTSVVKVSANILRANSKLVILSYKFYF